MARTTLGVRRNLKEKQRRASISQAAVKVFSEKGYVSSTMDDIVMEAGCSKSLIYWYWGSKAELFKSLVDKCMTMYIDLFEDFDARGDNYLEQVLEILGQTARIYTENVELNKLVHFGALQTSSKPNENFREIISGYKNRIIELIEKTLQDGIDGGFLRPDIDAAAMALHLMCLAEGYVYLSILEERMPLERMFGELQKYFTPGIMAPG